jgi:hypothetical protein
MTAHRPRLCLLMAIASTAALLLFSAPARADNITEWSENASRALFPAQGAIAFPHMAMVHAAMFDAVNAIDRRYEPYLVAPRAKPWFSQDAAAATAAYRVLVDGDVVAPDQRAALRRTLTPVYDAAIAAIDEGAARDGGVRVGEAAAWTMIASRSSDGRWGTPGFPLADPLMPGDWRPTAANGLNDPGAWLRNVDPFFVRDPDRFLSGGPNPLKSRAYLRDYDEVRLLGKSDSTVRVQDQTDAARFWGTVNAVSTWSTLIRGLAEQRPLSAVDRTRFYALIYLNGADTAIATWRDKAKWMFWRPVTAIKQGDDDGNRKTVGDPSWESLIAAPPYPDHASGLSAAAGSITATARELFGTDRVTFSGTITPPPATPPTDPITRTYTRLSQARDEIVDARVWSGIHFRIADEDGAAIGGDVARWRRHHPILLPLRNHG